MELIIKQLTSYKSSLSLQLQYDKVETRLILDFINIADNTGLELSRLEELKENISSNGTVNNVLYSLNHNKMPHPIFGLAQHHGIPTRFLDWTRNPLYAAFFAASSKVEDNEGFFSIWALKSNILKNSIKKYQSLRDSSNSDNDMRIMEVKKSDNKFLFAQEGLFTYFHNSTVLFCKENRYPCIESLFEAFESTTGEEMIYKIDFPKKHRLELLRLLAIEGVSKIRLMPSYDNVLRTLELRHL